MTANGTPVPEIADNKKTLWAATLILVLAPIKNHNFTRGRPENLDALIR